MYSFIYAFNNIFYQVNHKVFPNIMQNYKKHVGLIERATSAARNKDLNYLNVTIQNGIPGQLISYKSVDTVMSEDEWSILCY